MAGPTRISQLNDGSPVQPTDQVPVARGSGATGYTYKVNAGRIVSDLFNVGNSSTVDLTFDTSTRTLCAAANIPEATVNVVDSSTIDLDWNATTRTLSADASYLLTLINTLSTNMQNIGNYPYLEYAWVTAPNAAGQTITANTSATLTLTNEITDAGSYGSLSSNQITLSAGTYQFLAEIPYGSSYSTGTDTIFSLFNTTNSTFVTRKRVPSTYGNAAGVTNSNYELRGQFTTNLTNTFELRILCSVGGTIAKAPTTTAFTIGVDGLDQRTTIKLWKVG